MAHTIPPLTDKLPPFSSALEVIVNPLWLYVDVMPAFIRRPLLRFLEQADIAYKPTENWTLVSKVMHFYQLVEQEFGAEILFDLGKKGTNILSIPPHIQVLSDMLAYFDELYQANHRGGYAGFYKLLHYDPEQQQYTFRIHTPYPKILNKGVLTGFGRTYGNMVYIAELPHPVPNQANLSDQWFSISYR